MGDNLLKLQKRNIEKMKDIFKEYQPSPFSKAWGGNPEYAELSKRLKNVLLAEQGNIFGVNNSVSMMSTTAPGSGGGARKKKGGH